MRLKYTKDIGWDERPKIEAPFFAQAQVKKCFTATADDGFGTQTISDIELFLNTYNPSLYFFQNLRRSPQGLERLLTAINDLNIVLIHPESQAVFLPMVRWQSDKKNKANGQWIVSKEACFGDLNIGRLTRIIDRTRRDKFNLFVPLPTMEELLSDTQSPSVLAAAELNEKKALCDITMMRIQSGDQKRSFILDLVGGKPTEGERYLIQVIAGNSEGTANKLRVTVKGHCEKGKKECPEAKVIGPKGAVISPGTNLIAPLTAPKLTTQEDSLRTFFKHLFVPENKKPETYRVKTSSCDAETLEADIEVYPKIGWEGGLELNYEHATHKDSNFNQNQGFKKLKVQGQWKLDGKIKASHGDTKWEFKGETGTEGAHKNKNKLTEQFFKGAQEFLDQAVPMLGDIKSDYGTIAIKWPKLKLSGGLKNVELKDKHTLSTEGKISIGLSPLIGAEFKTDILNWIIKITGDAAGGYGGTLVKIKKIVATQVGNEDVNVGAVIALNLTVGGEVGGELNWTKSAGDNWVVKEGKISANMSFSLEGIVEIKGSFFNVSAGAGLTLGLKSAESNATPSKITGEWIPVTGKDGPGMKGQIVFNGLAVYYTEYAWIGVKNLKNDVMEDQRIRSRTNRRSQKAHQEQLKKEKEIKLYEICSVKTWPQTESITSMKEVVS